MWSWTCCTHGPSTHQCVAHYLHLPAGRIVHCAVRSLCFSKMPPSHLLEHALRRTGFQQPLGQLAHQHERTFHIFPPACGHVLVERRACPTLWPTPVFVNLLRAPCALQGCTPGSQQRRSLRQTSYRPGNLAETEVRTCNRGGVRVAWQLLSLLKCLCKSRRNRIV